MPPGPNQSPVVPHTPPTQLSASGIHAATTIWHDCLATPDKYTLHRLSHTVRECRSKLVSGFEAVIMARLLLEQGAAGKAAILSGNPPWEDLWPTLLSTWGMSAPELAARFDAQRMHQATHDPHSWAASCVVHSVVE